MKSESHCTKRWTYGVHTDSVYQYVGLFGKVYVEQLFEYHEIELSKKYSDRRSDVITTEELEQALITLKGSSEESKIKHLVRVLDEDHDGNINLEELGEVSKK